MKGIKKKRYPKTIKPKESFLTENKKEKKDHLPTLSKEDVKALAETGTIYPQRIREFALKEISGLETVKDVKDVAQRDIILLDNLIKESLPRHKPTILKVKLEFLKFLSDLITRKTNIKESVKEILKETLTDIAQRVVNDPSYDKRIKEILIEIFTEITRTFSHLLDNRL